MVTIDHRGASGRRRTTSPAWWWAWWCSFLKHPAWLLGLVGIYVITCRSVLRQQHEALVLLDASPVGTTSSSSLPGAPARAKEPRAEASRSSEGRSSPRNHTTPSHGENHQNDKPQNKQNNNPKNNNPKHNQPKRRETKHPPEEKAAADPDDDDDGVPSWDHWLAGQARVREHLLGTTNRAFLPLTAVLESPPRPGHQYTKPLPLRANATTRTVPYPNHLPEGCKDLANHWPVGHPSWEDGVFGPNVGHLKPSYPLRHEYAEQHCPVDADPFLPWIHDVIPSHDGTTVSFVAFNKRRCKRDPEEFAVDIANLEPQVALMQSLPLKRIPEAEYAAVPGVPEEWKRPPSKGEHRYRLVPLEEADGDAHETRFVCRFHALRPAHGEGGVEPVVLGETLSRYPYNYEHANYRHRRGQSANPMFTRPKFDTDVDGIHNEQIWNAMLYFDCPVPPALQSLVRNGSTVTREGTPSLYLDVVPVRTPPRENLTGYAPQILDLSVFDPGAEWGDHHVLPPVDKSGRWANIPVCPPPARDILPATTISDPATPREPTSDGAVATTNTTTSHDDDVKQHFMVGCLWASAVFSERGSRKWDTHTSERLLEWLVYHLEIAGFDHMVVYDNTEAHTNETSLGPIVDLFPPERVTRIPWKHRVCNNNPGGSPNAGERSSQYAAEASCRVRYGPTTEWMAFFDTDEYLVPSGNWSSIKEWLTGGVRDGTIEPRTSVLSFYETKAMLNQRFTEPYHDETKHCHKDCEECHCLAKRANATFLESFCEPFPFPREHPKTKTKMKQIYRPAFVLNHFVHYAAVTRLVHDKPKHPRVPGWPFERRAREFDEAYMVHTKTRLPRTTKGWKSTDACKNPRSCPVGLPWPHYQGENTTSEADVPPNRDEYEGFPYNCYELRKVQEDLAGRLHRAMVPYLRKSSPGAATRLQR